MQVNIKQNGVDLAPMEWARAQQMLATGTLRLTDHVWDSQSNQWVTLDHFSRQIAHLAMAQPVAAGGGKAAGFKWMMVTMGILCAVTAIGFLVWYLSSGDDEDAVAKKGDDKKKAAKGPNKGEPKREVAGGSKRPEIPPVADDASVVLSIDTQQVIEQAMGMRELTRSVLMIPGGPEILDMIRSNELTFPDDLHGVTWLARPPPVLARAGVSHVQVIYLPMDNNIAVQKVIEDSGLDAGELIEFENREHYRALVSNLNTRAMRLGFDDHAMAVVILMDEDNDGIDLEFLEGDAEDKAREHLNDLLEKALPKDPTPPSNPRLLAFLKSPSVGGMHMNFKNLPDGMFEKAFQRPDADPGFNAFMNTVRQNLSLGMTVDVADGSATARVDIWHDKLDGSVAGRGVPEVLLNVIPAGSQVIAGLSLNSKAVLEFIERELTPMLADNAVLGQPNKLDQVKAMVQLATGLSFNDMAEIFKGDFVVAASGLETMAAGRPPRLIVGARIGSEQKLAILLAALNRSGALVELSKEGIALVQRPGYLFLCSNIYANALRNGPLPNNIRGAHRDLLAQNQVALVARPQRFGRLLDTLGDEAAFLKNLREITVTSRLEKGRQSIEAKLAFRDSDMNLLQLFLERGGNLGGNRPVGNGSGFFITEDGYFITNHHVVDGGDKFKVKTPEGELAARVIKTDAKADLALLKIDSPGKFQPLPIIDSKTVSLGEQVFTIGFPKIDIQGVEPKLTPGNISSLKGFRDNPGRFQMTVPVQPGNSGGPLVNYYGNVVGVVVTQGNLQLLQNVNGAVKSGELIKFLQSVPAVRAKLRRPLPQAAKPEFTDVVKYVKTSSALVLVYRDF